jgi:hypothetical protein
MAEYSAGEDASQTISKPPSSYLSSFYYDCSTSSDQTLRFLIDTCARAYTLNEAKIDEF